jgi:hypothetical protein
LLAVRLDRGCSDERRAGFTAALPGGSHKDQGMECTVMVGGGASGGTTTDETTTEDEEEDGGYDYR